MGRKVDLNTRKISNNLKRNNHNFTTYENTTQTNEQINENINQEEIANQTYQREYELPEEARVTIKFPIAVKMTLALILVFAVFFLLMLFIILFSQENNGGSGLYKYGQTCTKITITDTENYKYDGEATFDEYIQGVVAAQSNGNTNLEYLKLLSVVVRTYSFKNLSSSCTVEGNDEFQKYQTIDSASNKELVKEAVNETKDLIILQDEELFNIEYCEACIINEDSDYYYLRNKSTDIQKISKTWATEKNLSTILINLYKTVDKTTSDYAKRECPENNEDIGISKIGSFYLIDNENYNYENTLKYYLDENIQIVKNEKELIGNGEFINPTTQIVCTSPFGERMQPITGEKETHLGIDIAVPGGEPIFASKAGIVNVVVKNVTSINNCQYGYGNYMVIDHQDGTSTLYAHMKYKSVPYEITVGSEIQQGEEIGQVGSTGCSTGYHLHYEVKVDGSNVNPADYLDLTYASGTCSQ